MVVSFAAVALILRGSKGKREALFIKRKVRKDDPWSGDIGLPGGKHKLEDGNLLNTAIRETLEEVNIDLRKHKLLGDLPYVTSSIFRNLKIKPFIFFLEGNEKIKKGEEIEQVFWIPLSSLQKKRIMISKIKKRRMAFIYNDLVIWGLTFRILCLAKRKYPQFF